jgi:trk system potassium uptake protein TrkH
MSRQRHTEFMRHRWRIMLGYSGLVSVLVGLIILAPCLGLLFFPGEIDLAWGVALPGTGLSLLGIIIWRGLLPRGGATLSLQEGAVVVVLSWLLAVIVGAVPFILIGGLDFTQAVFEATSAWTTTGLSVVDVEKASRLLLLLRSVMQLAGGAGLAIIMLSALTGPSGSGLSAAEGRADQLVPHVRRSAKLVMTMYSGYVVFGCIALYLAGMGWFDAVNHAFAALSTGGFSTRTASIGYWNSPGVEAVTILLMLLGTMNFVTGYALMHGKFRAVCKNGEIRLQMLVLPAAALIAFTGVTANLYSSVGQQVRVAIFETVSALSTTGFSTVGYGNWNGLGWLLLIGLMIIGGGTGSTAGGLKQYRIYVLYRSLATELRRMFLPRRAVTEPDVWVGEQRRFLQDRDIRQIAAFAFLYLLTLALGTGILTAYGYSLKESLFEFASALGTVGLSVGVTSADLPAGLLWTETVGMVLGRLEFFVLFLGTGKILSGLFDSCRKRPTIQ